MRQTVRRWCPLLVVKNNCVCVCLCCVCVCAVCLCVRSCRFVPACLSVYACACVSVSYLIKQQVSRSMLLHTQVTHPRHELIRVEEETGTQQEGEDVRPLMENKKKKIVNINSCCRQPNTNPAQYGTFPAVQWSFQLMIYTFCVSLLICS